MATDKQSELEAHDERNTDLVNRLEDKKKRDVYKRQYIYSTFKGS